MSMRKGTGHRLMASRRSTHRQHEPRILYVHRTTVSLESERCSILTTPCYSLAANLLGRRRRQRRDAPQRLLRRLQGGVVSVLRALPSRAHRTQGLPARRVVPHGRVHAHRRAHHQVPPAESQGGTDAAGDCVPALPWKVKRFFSGTKRVSPGERYSIAKPTNRGRETLLIFDARRSSSRPKSLACVRAATSRSKKSTAAIT